MYIFAAKTSFNFGLFLSIVCFELNLTPEFSFDAYPEFETKELFNFFDEILLSLSSVGIFSMFYLFY